MAKLTTKNKGKLRRIPNRVVGETHQSIAQEMIATDAGDQWNTSPSSNKFFTFVCTVCGEPSESRMATKVRANDEGREHRACIYCGAPINRKIKKKPEPISKKLRAELVPDSKLTPVSHVVTGMSEVRLWDCSNCTDGRGKQYRFVASVAARTRSFNSDAVISKYNLPPQDCPQCVESVSLFAADSGTEFDHCTGTLTIEALQALEGACR